MENTVKITLNPYGKKHAAAAVLDDQLNHRQAFISRNGVVYVSTNSMEDAPDYDGLTEFAREADAALRAAVADQ
jgi:hypothetical protein